MVDLSIAPERFIQQKRAISRIGEFLKDYGDKPLFIADNRVLDIISDKIRDSLEEYNIPFKFSSFEGECCEEEIAKATDAIKREKAHVVIGCGGGKAIDTAKAAAHYTSLSFVSIPTSAATCAAFSSICPVYSRKGEYLGTKELKKVPDLALVDSQIIAEAPSRFLAAGMIDSLAKWYEGRTTTAEEERRGNLHATLALHLSKYLKELIEKNGPQARADVDKKMCSSPVEKVIEGNIFITGLIGGVGGKNFRSVAAHAFNYATSGMPEFAGTLHGERVGIGLLIQLLLEGEREKLVRLVEFYRKIGMPCNLGEIGIRLSTGVLDEICRKMCSDSRINKLPFPVDENILKEAILDINNTQDLIESFSERSKLDDTVSTG